MKNLQALLNTLPSPAMEASEIQHLRETLSGLYETLARLIREHDVKQAEWDSVETLYPHNELYNVYIRGVIGREITNLAKRIVSVEDEIADIRKDLDRVTDSYRDQATWP